MSAPARVLRLIGVETLKVLGGKSLRTGLVAVVALTAFAAWNHETAAEETAWTVTATALSTGLWAAEIFLLVAGATAIAGETAQGTLKMILPHAYRRGDWIVAKATVLAAQALVLLLAALAVALAAGALSGGLGDVTRAIDASFGGEGSVERLHAGGAMAGHLASSATVALAALVATAWLGLAVSCVFDGLVPALSTAFLLFLGLKSAGTLFGAGPDVLSKIYASYPAEMLSRLEKLGLALNERWKDELFGRGLRLAAWVGAGSIAVSMLVFTRRDLQA